MNGKREILKPKVEDFITKLYEENYEFLLNYVLRNLKTNNFLVAEDIVHDTFCEAIKKEDILKEHVNPVGWLMQVTKYKIKSASRLSCNSEVFYHDSGKYQIPYTEEQYNLTELRMIIDKTFNDKEKKLFNLFYYEGYSVKEIAEKEEISEGNVKIRMMRLRKKLIARFDSILAVTFVFICYLIW